jgi:tetratricopeptide (TPR) repeat protein
MRPNCTRNRPAFAAALALLLAACAQGDTDTLETTAETVATEQVSQAALAIEQAQRLLDRGRDAERAKSLLNEALAEQDITVDERNDALLALSHAYERLGDKEAAITVIEKEMAARTAEHDHSGSHRGFARRLRELLTGSPTNKGLEPHKKSEAPPFARMLGKFFPAGDDGRVNTTFIIVGGDSAVSNAIGTFEVGKGLRASREESCPLCDNDLDIHISRSQSDWTSLAAVGSTLDEAMVIFYVDLGRNRIPARYERHLPMKVADIERELEQGKSFILGQERDGAPPVLLIAAPRTALLADVEAELAQMDQLPTEATYVDVPLRLRREEIQGIVRSAVFPSARTCYESLLEHAPQAEGSVRMSIKVAEDGSVMSSELSSKELGDDATFMSCMADAVDEMTFPSSGSKLTVTYPIAFTR